MSALAPMLLMAQVLLRVRRQLQLPSDKIVGNAARIFGKMDETRTRWQLTLAFRSVGIQKWLMKGEGLRDHKGPVFQRSAQWSAGTTKPVSRLTPQ